MDYPMVPYDLLFPYAFPEQNAHLENGDIVRERHNSLFDDSLMNRLYASDMWYFMRPFQ